MDGEDEERLVFLTPCPSEGKTTQYEQHMHDLTENLEQSLNFNFPSNNDENYESENESDGQAQQPTEATGDSNDPNQLQKDTVATTIDIISFDPQPSHDRDDICSPSNDIEPSNEIFSGVTPDSDIIYETKSIVSSNDVCTESLCVPYTDEQDEISILKETLTTTTTTTEYFEPKKGKNDPRHIMISYNHSTKVICSRIAKELRNRNYRVWIDQDDISGDVFTSMASAIENSFVVLMAVNEQYYNSRYCRLEAEYACERNKASIPMLMQAGYKAVGWLGLINGSKLHIDFNKLHFDEAFNLLVREIEGIRTSLGVDGFDQTRVSTYTQSSITTISSSWSSYGDAREWNGDDVIEWLNREKIEIFENILTGFTGATLWQLYKIKLDSPSDFYRTIEELLLPTVPRRLFYNLTFINALETLFSSSSQKIYR